MFGIIFIVLIAVGALWAFSNVDGVGVGCVMGIVIFIIGASIIFGWGFGQDWYQVHKLTREVHIADVSALSAAVPVSADDAPSSRSIALAAIADNDNAKIDVDRMTLKLAVRHCDLSSQGAPQACGAVVETRNLLVTDSDRLDKKRGSGLIAAGGRTAFHQALLVTNVPKGKAAVAEVTIARACSNDTFDWCK